MSFLAGRREREEALTPVEAAAAARKDEAPAADEVLERMFCRELRQRLWRLLQSGASEEQCRLILLASGRGRDVLSYKSGREGIIRLLRRPTSVQNRNLYAALLRNANAAGAAEYHDTPTLTLGPPRKRSRLTHTHEQQQCSALHYTWIWALVARYLSVGDLVRGLSITCRTLLFELHRPSIWRSFSLLNLRQLPESLSFTQQHLLLSRLAGLESLVAYRDVTANATLKTLSICCPKLKHLDLSDCIWISDLGMESIGSTLRNLEILILSSCNPGISDQCLRWIACLPRLHTLSLRHCLRVSDQGIHYFSRNAANQLLSLDLTGCLQISDSSLISITGAKSRLKKLQRLCLNGCFNVGDHGLASLQILHLVELRLAINCSVSDVGLLCALNEQSELCKTLETLDVRKCSQVSINSVRRLLEISKSLPLTRFLHSFSSQEVLIGLLHSDTTSSSINSLPQDLGVLGWVRHRVQQGLGLLRDQVAPLGVLTAGLVTASVLPGYVLGVSLVSGLWAASLAAVLQSVDD